MRDISGAVGIKESTIYYHFKNKRDILDCITEECMEIVKRVNSMLARAFDGIEPSEVDDNGFFQVARVYYANFLNDEKIFMFLSMLMLEQYNSPEFGTMLTQLMFDEPVELQTKYFDTLINYRYIKNLPAGELAFTYHAIMYFCFCRQAAMGQSAAQGEEELIRRLKFFVEQYRR